MPITDRGVRSQASVPWGTTLRAPLSRRTHGPAVRWVHGVLRHEMRTGGFPDNALPSEDALIQRYKVSRGTIRRVMELLRDEGLIERHRGAGTFILGPTTVSHGVNVSRDFAIDVNHAGVRASIFATHVELRPATDFVADRLRLEPGAEVVIIESLTYLDGFPFSFRTAFHPASLFPSAETPDGDLSRETDLNRSPYLILCDLLGERPGDTALNITAGITDESVAELLGIPAGGATLDTNRVIYTRHGVPVEYSVSRARADRISFEVLMTGLASTAHAGDD